MKNSFKAVLGILLTLSLVLVAAVPVFAAKEVNVKVDIAGEKGKVYVRLTVPAGSDISTASVSVKFDTEKLSFNKVDYISDDTIVSLTNDSKKDEGEVAANLIIADSLVEESKMFTFVFDMNESAKGDLSFDFVEAEATDSANNPVTLVFEKPAVLAVDALKPLTPDVTQGSFKPPVTESETKPAESTTAESTTEAAESTTAAAPSGGEKIPSTAVARVIIGFGIGIIMVTVAVAFMVWSQKKRKNRE